MIIIERDDGYGPAGIYLGGNESCKAAYCSVLDIAWGREAASVRRELSDIPTASLYRHIKVLYDAGLY